MSGLVPSQSSTLVARIRGDSAAIALSLIDPDSGAAFDPTGNTLIFTLKKSRYDADGAALIQKISTIGGFTTTDAVNGRVTLSLVPADYALLISGRVYPVDVQAQNVSTGAVKTVYSGGFAFEQDVTQGTTLSISTTVVNPTAPGFQWLAYSLTGIASGVLDATKLCGITGAGTSIAAGAIVRASFPGNVIAEFTLEATTATSANFLFAPYNYDAVTNAVKWRLNRVSRLGSPCAWNVDAGKWCDIYAIGAAGFVALAVDQTGFSLPA